MYILKQFNVLALFGNVKTFNVLILNIYGYYCSLIPLDDAPK